MHVRELETAPSRVARPPRAMAWVLLLASGAAVLVTGIVGTALIFGNVVPRPDDLPVAFWAALCAAAGLTIVSASIRSLRWVFLLRRAETRIPIRDAYIGYLAGLSLLVAPLLLGEIAVRGWIHRRRGAVPITTTAVVNIWERCLDLSAVGAIAGIAGVWTHQATPWNLALLAGAGAAFVTPLRRAAFHAVVSSVAPLTDRFDFAAPLATRGRSPGFDRLPALQTWSVAWVASVAAWLLPGIGFWLLAAAWSPSFGLVQAEYAYGASAGLEGLTLAPGGVLVAGRQMLAALALHGFPQPIAIVTVFSVRLATAGVSMVLGAVFVAIHWCSSASGASHFDEIADAYDVQIHEARRRDLLDRKTALMRDVLRSGQGGVRGLDVGCGQGTYVARMGELGFDVTGIDESAGQVKLAERKVGRPGLVVVGSALDIPAEDGTYDFVYIINVLHHLPSVADQRRAFAELLRVLKPGGVLFVHEINTRNALFRFYMGYVFPSLNCIDEGVERWLLPNRLQQYTDAPIEDVRYFTFLPEFVPGVVVRLLRPLERWLESSRLRVYSAHYMAVVRRPA